MFAFRLALLALPIIGAAASAVPGKSCSTGNQQCCNTVQDAKSLTPIAKGLFGALGIDVNSLTGLVGVTCTPITGIGGGVENNCVSGALCCEKTYQNGFINSGCTQILP